MNHSDEIRKEPEENGSRPLDAEELGAVTGGESAAPVAAERREPLRPATLSTNNLYCVRCGQSRPHLLTKEGRFACQSCGTVYSKD